MILEIICLVVAVVSVAIAAYSWWHAARWTRALQETRLAIAYKRKVKRNHSFAEWMKYATALTQDTEGGNVVYNLAGTSIAVFRTKRQKKVKADKK